MYKEYDVIRTIRSLSDKVTKGTIGTILIIYEGVPTQYEIEFVDQNSETIATLTVAESDIELVD